MLEEDYISSYDIGFQEGFEKGYTKSKVEILTALVREVQAFVSEKKWEQLKAQEEKAYLNRCKDNILDKSECDNYFDESGRLIKEKWVENRKYVLRMLNFPEDCWNELCDFARKYPGLSPNMLTRRIIRESEYKYI